MMVFKNVVVVFLRPVAEQLGGHAGYKTWKADQNHALLIHRFIKMKKISYGRYCTMFIPYRVKTKVVVVFLRSVA